MESVSLFLCRSVVDIDECKTGAHNCGDHAQCTNTKGAFVCVCENGYTATPSGCVGKSWQLRGTDRLILFLIGFWWVLLKKSLDNACEWNTCNHFNLLPFYKYSILVFALPLWKFTGFTLQALKCHPTINDSRFLVPPLSMKSIRFPAILFWLDADECGTGTDNCHENAKCENTIGSFTCTCNDGFKKEGNLCIGK